MVCALQRVAPRRGYYIKNAVAMKLYFLRHGKADWPQWDRPDDERPLNNDGKREMERIARLLRDLKIQPSVILSSPFPRAWQTAEIAAKHLEADLREEPALKKGFNVTRFRPLIKKAQSEDLMLVGHEPDFSALIKALTGGQIELKKGGIARVDLADVSAARGKLVWLIPPKIPRL